MVIIISLLIVSITLFTRLRLQFSDTDSLCLLIENDTLDRVITALKPIMDFSNYPKSHPLYDKSHARQPSFYKDETASQFTLREVCAIRSKVYAYRTYPTPFNADTPCDHLQRNLQAAATFPPSLSPGGLGPTGPGARGGAARSCSLSVCHCLSAKASRHPSQRKKHEKKICKGVAKVGIRKDLTFDKYKACLLERRRFHAKYHAIRSKNEQVTTVEQNRLALSSTDTKRYYFPCAIHSVPFGSCVVEEDGGECRRCPSTPITKMLH